jgi:GNAT superfamily N-acetyltransferase
VSIREATTGDREVLIGLVDEFEHSLPPLPYPEDTPEEDWSKLEKRMREGLVLIAEDEGRPVGFTSADFYRGHVFVVDLYVREAARRRGVGLGLLERVADAARERGITHMELDVDSRNADALSFYERLGFDEGAKVMRIALDALHRLKRGGGEYVGAVHVQTDDAGAVERVVNEFLPRMLRAGEARFEASRTWTAVRVMPFDLDTLRRLGSELSYRFGVTAVLTMEDSAVVRFVLHDRGRMVDEYLSVPEYFGPLPPGDALALRSNPTVVSRLTGADPARLRAVARTAASPAELPPAADLYRQIGELMGLEP